MYDARAMGVALTDIVTYLDDFLQIRAFSDNSLNGLQVEGPVTVSKIVAAVDSDRRAIQEAIEADADLMVVHHGLFWSGQERPLTGPEFQRVKLLIDSGTAVYAAHLPLDAHPEVGNNAELARLAGAEKTEPWGEHRGQTIGLKGTLREPLVRGDLADWARNTFGDLINIVDTGPETIRTVGFCSGAAATFAEQAQADGLDLFITGEPRHGPVHRIREVGQNALFIGHHTSERGGPQALAAHLADRFDLVWEFVDSPTGV